MKAIITFNFILSEVSMEISGDRYLSEEEFRAMVLEYAKMMKKNMKAEGFEVEILTDEIVSHVIPSNLLESFIFYGKGKERSAKGTYLINNFTCEKWIQKVEYYGRAEELPTVTITGRLSRLDDERKKSWGINF